MAQTRAAVAAWSGAVKFQLATGARTLRASGHLAKLSSMHGSELKTSVGEFLA
jgi:hypothetical protein